MKSGRREHRRVIKNKLKTQNPKPEENTAQVKELKDKIEELTQENYDLNAKLEIFHDDYHHAVTHIVDSYGSMVYQCLKNGDYKTLNKIDETEPLLLTCLIRSRYVKKLMNKIEPDKLNNFMSSDFLRDSILFDNNNDCCCFTQMTLDGYECLYYMLLATQDPKKIKILLKQRHDIPNVDWWYHITENVIYGQEYFDNYFNNLSSEAKFVLLTDKAFNYIHNIAILILRDKNHLGLNADIVKNHVVSNFIKLQLNKISDFR